jgi:hypothetical protein
VTRGRASPRELKLGRKTSPSGSLEWAVEIDEMLQHRFAEWRQPDDHVGGQPAGIERKIQPSGSAAIRPAEVMFHTAEMAHFFHSYFQDGAAPTPGGGGFGRAQAFFHTALQAEGGV